MLDLKTNLNKSFGVYICVIVLTLLTAGGSGLCVEAGAPSLTQPAKSPQAPIAHFPFPQHITYAPGTLHPNHISREQQDQIVRKAYDQWKRSYITSVENGRADVPMFRVNAGPRKKNLTFSEGQGFGMIVVAIMAGHDPEAKSVFDGLWQFSRLHPSRIDKRLMAYKVPVRRDRRNSAFDGDCDIAYGLLLAYRQWGNAGKIDYRAEASTVIKGLMTSVIGPESRLPMLGDWVKPNGPKYHQRTIRTSDIMPGHFRTFARATGEKTWLRTLAECQILVDAIQATVASETGLLPDFVIASPDTNTPPKPAPVYFLEGFQDGRYYYNAARVPLRIGIDALTVNDPISLRQVRRMASWIIAATEGVPARIKPGYKLNGRPLSGKHYFSKTFVAPFGIAVMTLPHQQSYLNQAFDLINGNSQGYYEDTIGLLCLLVMTGNFWDPMYR